MRFCQIQHIRNTWSLGRYPVWDNAKLADYYTTTSRDFESVSADILYAHMPLIRSRL